MQKRNPRAIDVKPLEGYRLLITFDNQERRIFDVKPYINGSWFSELRKIEVFNAVKRKGLSVGWPDGQDICPDELYEKSTKII